MRAFHFNSLRWKKAFSSGLIKQTSSSTIASLPCYFHLFNKHGGWNKRGGWAEFFFFHYVKKCTEGKGKLFVYYYIKKLEEEAKSEKNNKQEPTFIRESRVSKPIFFLVEKFLVNKVWKKPREVLKSTWSCLFWWFLAFKHSINIRTVNS